MGDAEDREITLGTGKLLGMFLALVVICAVFFGLGYALGRSSAKQGASTSDALPPPVATSAAPKPSAAKGLEAKPEAAAPSTSDELTFYKSVEQKDANPQLPAAATPAAPAPAAPPPATATPELTKPAPGGYVVQVAAVSKQEDADALVGALRKKQYPVFVTSAEADKLFHVQVGPFSDVKEAEAVRAKLTSDGYSPILKR